MLKTLFDYTAANLSGLTKSGNWQYGHMLPNTEGTVSALLERVSIPRDQDNRNYRQFRLQLFTRANTFNTAKTEAERIWGFLFGLQGVALSGYYLYDVAGGDPAYIGQDEKDRYMFSTNFTITARKDS